MTLPLISTPVMPPLFHVSDTPNIVSDRAKSQRGSVLESLGYYDPSFEPPKFSLDESRMVFWISSGAQVSEAVSALVKRFKKVSLASVKS